MIISINMKQYSFWSRGFAFAGLLVIVAWTWAVFGPHVIDDAYITFRYARNMAIGRGIVYNPGERFQGGSTPFFTLLLGFCGWLGLNIPTSALVVGLLSGGGTLVLLIIGGKILGREGAGWLAAFALTTQLLWVLLLVSGMETTLYCLVILSTILMVAQGRWKGLGILLGLACLIRYDGAILAVAALLLAGWNGGFKTALREALKAAIIYLPWFIFAWIYFGTPVPQSIRGKLLIDFLTYSETFKQYWLYLKMIPLSFFWLGAFLIGTFMAIHKDSRWAIVPLWFGLYLAIFILERRPVLYYPWYLIPLFPIFFLMAAFGFSQVLQFILKICVKLIAPTWQIKKIYQPAFLMIACLTIFFQLRTLIEEQGLYGSDMLHRERKYQIAAEILTGTVRPGESVYVGEVGTLGWFMPDARMIDSASVLSPKVYDIRWRDRQSLLREGKKPEDYPDGTPAITMMVIDELKPDYIITRREFLFLGKIKDDPHFKSLYEEIKNDRLPFLEQWAFRRKKSH